MSRKPGFVELSVAARLARLGRQPTLLEYALLRAGLRKGAQVVAFGAWWVIWRQGEGADLPKGERGGMHVVRRYAQWARCSYAKAYRELAEWREVFGPLGWPTPDGLAEYLLGQWTNRAELWSMSGLSRSEAALVIGTLPAPAAAA